MKTSDAIASLVEYALRGAPEAERVHVYDAAVALGQDVAVEDRREIAQIAERAAVVAAHLRGADAAQIQFREMLNLGGQGK